LSFWQFVSFSGGSRLSSETFAIQFQYRRVVHQSIDCSHRRDRVFKNLVPLREGQIASGHNASPLVPFCQQDEQDIGFFSVLRNVGNEVDPKKWATG
jgi:hypothetical protein